MPLRLALLAALCSTVLLAPAAHADENYFGYVYGSETLPAGGNEAYLWLTYREDKGAGHYDAQDVQVEFEHGFTDRFQASLYVTGRAHDIRGAAPIEDGEPEYPDLKRDLSWDGVKAAFKWNLRSPFKDGVGVAVYLEPSYSSIFKISGEKQDEWGLEAKLIVQKNFLDDQLVTAANLTIEPEWRVIGPAKEHEKEVEVELTAGASYRFAPNWFTGLEMRTHTEHPDFGAREHWALFVGPNLHYGGHDWWFTATWMPQIKGGPVDPERSGTLHLGEHEKNEYRLKIGYNF